MHLRCEGGHAEPKAFLEVEISLLLVILVLLHVVLIRKKDCKQIFVVGVSPAVTHRNCIGQ